MNDPMVIAAALVLVIASVSTAVVATINAVSKMRAELGQQIVSHAEQVVANVKVAAEAVVAKVEEVKVTTKEISGLVNGNATVGADKIDVLEQRIMQLHARLEEVQERRVEDAKTKAATETRSQ